VLLLQSFLEDEGFDVVPTFDGKEAIEETLKQKPDLVLLDLMMPKIDGFKVLEAIRNNKETKDTKVIFISADRELSNVQKAKEMGVLAYVMKPIDFDEILKEVNKAFA